MEQEKPKFFRTLKFKHFIPAIIILLVSMIGIGLLVIFVTPISDDRLGSFFTCFPMFVVIALISIPAYWDRDMNPNKELLLNAKEAAEAIEKLNK